MNLGAFPTVAVPTKVAFPAGGRLTLVSGSPVISSDQTGKSVIYYTPDQYGAFPIIKNGVIRPVYFSDDLQLTMTSAFTGSGIFDLFGVERGGRGVMVAGTAWSVATAGSGARGTTPGQTELIRVAGMSVNRWGMPGLSAENATYIEPMEGRYLGSVFIDSSAGQTSCHVSYGQSRKWGLSNADNRRDIILKAGDSTASWTYSTNTARASNNSSANSLTVFCGLADEEIVTRVIQRCQLLTSASLIGINTVGIGWNVTNAFSGKVGIVGNALNGGTNITTQGDAVGEYIAAPSLGLNTVTSLEQSPNAGGGNTYFGTETNMVLSAKWRA